MDYKELFTRASEVLAKKYKIISFNADGINVKPIDPNGISFNVYIRSYPETPHTDADDYVMELRGYYFYLDFNDNDEALRFFTDLSSGKYRVLEVLKGTKIDKAFLEVNKNDSWEKFSKREVTMLLPFWRKPTERYLYFSPNSKDK